jgi:hypothetical protein
MEVVVFFVSFNLGFAFKFGSNKMDLLSHATHVLKNRNSYQKHEALDNEPSI